MCPRSEKDRHWVYTFCVSVKTCKVAGDTKPEPGINDNNDYYDGRIHLKLILDITAELHYLACINIFCCCERNIYSKSVLQLDGQCSTEWTNFVFWVWFLWIKSGHLSSYWKYTYIPRKTLYTRAWYFGWNEIFRISHSHQIVKWFLVLVVDALTTVHIQCIFFVLWWQDHFLSQDKNEQVNLPFLWLYVKKFYPEK